ncbi:MAG: RNHCP domain-containing protein [Candidatus Paceibacterota bacterium]
MEPKKFIRTIEDFVCEHCGVNVQGSGYTNHCPKCLWSKHVDVNPGDRLANCCGLMKPISAVQEDKVWFIIQKCQKCDHERRNKFGPEDSFDELIIISQG